MPAAWLRRRRSRLAPDARARRDRVNPRLTCAYVGLSAALGRNLAAESMVAHALPTRELSDAAA
jgi:hypothetical protein